MSQVKWNNDDIFQFLDVYEQYPILWNIKHKDYLNRNLKISNFEKLKNNLSSIGLVVDSDQLRLKIFKSRFVTYTDRKSQKSIGAKKVELVLILYINQNLFGLIEPIPF